MQSVFIVISFWSNEKVTECPAKMLAKLNEIKNLYLERKLRIFREIVVYVHRRSCSTKPSREICRVLEQDESKERH